MLLKTHIFGKKGNLSSEETLWPKYFCSTEHKKCHETTYNGPEVKLTCIVQAI